MEPVPKELQETQLKFFGEAGRRWVRCLPKLATDCVERWGLTLDGRSRHGAVAWVLPVRRPDGTPAVLKLQPMDQETRGEPDALRAWGGDGAVRLLEADEAAGAILLERLDPDRTLESVENDLEALQVVAELLARLNAIEAPDGMRTLAGVAADLLGRTPAALAATHDDELRALLRSCASAVAEVQLESGNRLLHWDLHYQNVLAPPASSDRDSWLAIDPKPLAGDPAFELLAALHNRWHNVVATGDIDRAVRRRFDLMIDIIGLDSDRARAWTLGRVLQDLLLEVEEGEPLWSAACDREIARILLSH